MLVYKGAPTGGIPYTWKITTWNATKGDLIVDGSDTGFYSSEGPSVVGYGIEFHHFTDMRTRAISLYTGKVVWTSDPMDAPWGVYAAYSLSVGYGKVYIDSYDGHLYCYDANTEKTVWKFFLGNGVLIQGTVTDQSLGQPGTPAISDQEQAAWMQYLYQQMPMPTNVTGVPVHLQAMLSNGTVIDVGHVTSDLMGHYEYAWTPPVEDTYKILATFEGSESYYASSGQTGLL
jgi:outer membrane protein assembly factor BamB